MYFNKNYRYCLFMKKKMNIKIQMYIFTFYTKTHLILTDAFLVGILERYGIIQKDCVKTVVLQ